MQPAPPKPEISPGGISRTFVIGVLCGAFAALGWAAGFVVAKHGIEIGFTPADLGVHRYVWSGLVLIPLIFQRGIRDLGGIGWKRGFMLTVLAGPTQALLAYSGFMLVPLGHGSTIQPATAAATGIILSALILRERPSASRILGGIVITGGLVVFGIESLTTIGKHGIGGDFLFIAAGACWATFGILIRQWNATGMLVVAVIGLFSVLVFAPFYFLFFGIENMVSLGWKENIIQILVQSIIAGVLPLFLFARAVTDLGASRAATFPALVPGFALLIAFLLLGSVPSWPQLVGLAIVLVGFRLTLR